MVGIKDIGVVGVAGLGTMGSGIAEVCARAGFSVRAFEPGSRELESGRARLEASLGRAVERGKASSVERDEALERLSPTTDLGELADCGVVIEAVTENVAVKNELFGALDEVLSDTCLLATNTSALSVTAIASNTRLPERVVGLHFFNPAPVLALVEVVRTSVVADWAVELATEFVRALGKTPIGCGDTPGFVVNRILIPVLNDAVRTLDEGTADAEAIDAAMTLGVAWPIGPLALIDLIGIDVHVHVSEVLWDAYREARFAPPPRLQRMLDAGHLGRKAGRGFYEYGAAS